MKNWVFSTYKWQGNPKALFLYMTKYMDKTHECWWVADNRNDAKVIRGFGFSRVTYNGSVRAKEIFASANVYVSENFREKYPCELSPESIIFNTWHGVGLKHVELGIDEKSSIADAIVRKNVKNFDLNRNRTYFLVTSPVMKEHFVADTLVPEDRMIKGGYPRNAVYSDKNLSTFNFSSIIKNPKETYSRIGFFAPTWRSGHTIGIFEYLLPNLKDLEFVLSDENYLLIIKVHPMMQVDPYFKEARENFKNSNNILFWDDVYDIYEIFSCIDFAIVDYSSIFYDLLSAGVEKFIRYIPDYQEYTRNSALIGDYLSLTGGYIAEDFNGLLSILKEEIVPIDNKDYLLEYFFEYSLLKNIPEIVQEIDSIEAVENNHQELHSFDVFDTLIRRKTLAPLSIFSRVQQMAWNSNLEFPLHILENWPRLRSLLERDVRDMRRKTTFERDSDCIEITFDAIFERIAENINLTSAQVNFLKDAEVKVEVEHVEPISERIDFLFDLIKKGNKVILISDMYLPESVIREMLKSADERLLEIPLYLSASIGHQKSTGKLYKHIFFQNKYNYQRWVHYGDNAHADGSVPRRLGIETFVHQMDKFIPYENALINGVAMPLKYDAYRMATALQRYRKNLLDSENSQILEKKYYAYAYAGMALVPYVHWTILDAIRRGYDVLYFISRDGHFLKLIADSIIEKAGYSIITKFIYGSRRAWRVPSFIDSVDSEMFGPFGNFVSMDSFEDLIRASLISEEEFLLFFPQFEVLRHARHLRGEVAENIRKTLEASDSYKQRVLKIAAEQRVLVRDYLRQQIDFNERFAFVEFWGRGYTQDVFGRLLNDAAGHSVYNAFYYVRSFTENKGAAVRHNFMLMPNNFSYFEPVFAVTPYDSIISYERNALGQVQPTLTERPSQMAEYISEGLLDFVSDYIKIADANREMIRELAVFTYDYQITNKKDQFICNVYAELKYSESSYGEIKAVAPVLTVKQLVHARDKKDLDVITKDIPISLARSSDAVRDFYRKHFRKMKWPNVLIEPLENVYASNDLKKYVRSTEFPFKVISICENAIYSDISFSQESKRKDCKFQAYEVFEVIAIDFLQNGVPRLMTCYGYVTANKDFVHKVVGENVQSELAELKSLSKVIDRIKSNNYISSGWMNIVGRMHSIEMSEVRRGKKWKKFVRNPYQFFEDSKKTSWHYLGEAFNPRHVLGRTLTKVVRRFVD